MINMKNTLFIGAILIGAIGVAGCSTPPKIAQNKSVQAEGQKLDFGGKFDVKPPDLTITVNGDPVLTGRFPPFTPTQNLTGEYKGLKIGASCYFASVLSSKGGLVGIIGGAVQSGQGKTGDKCDMTVNGKPTESLYF
jgi:hypothetical protein